LFELNCVCAVKYMVNLKGLFPLENKVDVLFVFTFSSAHNIDN
jgi:hypothetical protein